MCLMRWHQAQGLRDCRSEEFLMDVKHLVGWFRYGRLGSEGKIQEQEKSLSEAVEVKTVIMASISSIPKA